MTKLTLSMDEKVVEQAKRLAAKNGTSVSAMFTRFVQSMAGMEPRRGGVGRITRRASGIVSVPKGKTYRKVLEESLLEKYRLKA